MFISTTALTVPLSSDQSCMELCKEITRQHVKLFRHQKYPYSHILRDLHERFGFSGNLYDVIVSFQNAKSNSGTWSRWYSNGFCEVGLELHIDNRDSSNHYTVNIDYQTDLFRDDEEVTLLFRQLEHILEQIIRNPNLRLVEVSIIPDEDQHRMLDCFNRTDVLYDRSQCVHTLFREQAVKTPEKTALVFEGTQFTYRQLDKMSNSLAHTLRASGVGPGSIVPIIAKRSWHIIISMLSVLKAGGAYMPVDPSYPAERIQAMIDISDSTLALTYGYDKPLGAETIRLEDLDFHLNPLPVENRNSPDDLCYIIFTSGSTGTPKGVSICHRNVINYCHSHALNFQGGILDDDCVIVSVTNTIFDIFVTESLLPLVNGTTIYFANQDQTVSQKQLTKLIQNSPINAIQTTPTKLRSFLLDENNTAWLRQLRVIALGGEALPSDLYRKLRTLTDARVFNVYGPAETTV